MVEKESVSDCPRLCRTFRRRAPAALAAGLLTGIFAAWSYYDDHLRAISHTFGIWILVATLVSARQRIAVAIPCSILALWSAVLSFYVGKALIYGRKYPSTSYIFDHSQLIEWAVLAVIAGSILGLIFSHVGLSGRKGSAATAAALGLLIADCYRRISNYPMDTFIVASFAALEIVLVLYVSVRSLQQLSSVAIWIPLMTSLGWALVSAPDLIESFLLSL
jgi:hypothetical protein